jgi:multicomponent Na+:H+ antiporter subunit G
VSLHEVAAGGLLLGGSLVMLASAVAVVRFPDVYTRLHAAGKGDTLGQALVLLGLLLLAGPDRVALKLVLVIFFVFVFNPTATHALARGAWVKGLRPWTLAGADAGPQREGELGPAQQTDLLEEGAARAGEDGPAEGSDGGGP